MLHKIYFLSLRKSCKQTCCECKAGTPNWKDKGFGGSWGGDATHPCPEPSPSSSPPPPSFSSLPPLLPFCIYLCLGLSPSSFSSFLPLQKRWMSRERAESQPGESWLELRECCVGTEKPLLWFPCTKGAVPGTPDFPPKKWAGHGTSSQSIQS